MSVFGRALCALALALSVFGQAALAQDEPEAAVAVAAPVETARAPAVTPPPAGSAMRLYYDPAQGASSADLVRRALASNGELAAARLDIERARARLGQAGLRPNPTLDFEQTTGRLTGSPGESETSVGVSLPIELGGQRRRRVELARVELEAAEAEFADRERRLAAEVLGLYAEALAALRELEITEGLTDLDLKTVVVVQARVNEGESAPSS
jgi:outer membrane protein, heavy metal efflux system